MVVSTGAQSDWPLYHGLFFEIVCLFFIMKVNEPLGTCWPMDTADLVIRCGVD